jgi:hypothetical protein
MILDSAILDSTILDSTITGRSNRKWAGKPLELGLVSKIMDFYVLGLAFSFFPTLT